MENAPFGVAGLKFGSEGRRILKRCPIPVGAAHWAAWGFQVLHTFLRPCRGGPCGRPFMCETACPGGRALRRTEPHERRAATWGRPYSKERTGSVGSANPGAGVKPHQRQFLQTQGPVARNETMKATQILRAENYLPSPRGNPCNGGPGVRRIWTRSVHPEPSPGGSLVTFWPGE